MTEATAGNGDPVRVPENLAVDLAFLTWLQLRSSLTLAMRPSLNVLICKMGIILPTLQSSVRVQDCTRVHITGSSMKVVWCLACSLMRTL